ncbi:hypothetical protein V6N11_078444 [Hibiscus sabdariffa]|uniref:F-box domain-containing protein n=1 Tax=Hibiscus sabdariffa TaxID=183260 RepID=A0ABR2TH14_9ROSI
MERSEPELNHCIPKKHKRKFDSGDRISGLPDDVLVSILSRLPFKVATTTSLLSRRWRRAWTLVPRLDFVPVCNFLMSGEKASDEVLDNFLSNSPFLECLCVLYSRTLVRVRVSNLSLHLKNLEISFCPKLECLELHSTSLLTLKYIGRTMKIPFDNVPNLAELCIEGEWGTIWCPTPRRKLLPILTFPPRLQKLELFVDAMEEVGSTWPEFPLMSQLKHLELCVAVYDFDSLLFLSSWIKACPSLHRFTVDASVLV